MKTSEIVAEQNGIEAPDGGRFPMGATLSLLVRFAPCGVSKTALIHRESPPSSASILQSESKQLRLLLKVIQLFLISWCNFHKTGKSCSKARIH